MFGASGFAHLCFIVPLRVVRVRSGFGSSGLRLAYQSSLFRGLFLAIKTTLPKIWFSTIALGLLIGFINSKPLLIQIPFQDKIPLHLCQSLNLKAYS